MNNVSLVGRLTADADLRQTQNNVSVCRFTIAVTRPGVKDKTDFITCTAWRQQAEFIAKYFTKGKPIALTGILTSGEYEKDGTKHYYNEVLINCVMFVPQNKQDIKAGKTSPKKADQEPAELPPELGDFEEIIGEDNLPF